MAAVRADIVAEPRADTVATPGADTIAAPVADTVAADGRTASMCFKTVQNGLPRSRTLFTSNSGKKHCAQHTALKRCKPTDTLCQMKVVSLISPVSQSANFTTNTVDKSGP